MRSNKPVLVILTPGFPKNESDSTCLPAQQHFIKALNKNFPAVKIIILSLQYPFAKESYTWNGNTVYAFGGKNRGGLYRRLLWNSVLKRLEKIKQQEGIAGLLSFWCDECALTASRFSNKHSIKHFCWLFGQDAKPGNRYVSKTVDNNTAFIAISDFINEQFQKNYKTGNLPVIPLGIDTNEYPADMRQRDIDILAAGSMILLKQFDIVLQVAAALRKNSNGLKLVLCGDGPELSKLKGLAKQLGLEENVLFTGELPHTEVLRLMQRSKIFLHPSSYEGFGMVCAEALYAGAQVISFCKPMRQQIKNWHIAADIPDMQKKAALLLNALPVPERNCFFSSEETARSIVQLFGSELAE